MARKIDEERFIAKESESFVFGKESTSGAVRGLVVCVRLLRRVCGLVSQPEHMLLSCAAEDWSRDDRSAHKWGGKVAENV